MTAGIADTSVFIARESGRALDATALPDDLAVSIITIGELRASGVSVLLVEQNAQAALQFANRAYVMELGEFILDGPAKAVAADARIAASYLGFAQNEASGI